MSNELIRERYWRGWIDQYCRSVLNSGGQKIRLQFHSQLIASVPTINMPITKRQKFVIYWTEWDRIQMQCQDKLTQDLPHQPFCHYKLNKKHVNRLLESPIECCIVVSSDKTMLHQMSVHKTGYHLIHRPAKIDQVATNGYVARLIADIKEFVTADSRVQGVIHEHPHDPSLMVIDYNLGYYDDRQREDVVDCVLSLLKFHKSHITGLTIQSTISSHLTIEQ